MITAEKKKEQFIVKMRRAFRGPRVELFIPAIFIAGFVRYGTRAIENAYDHRSRRIRKVVKLFDGAAWQVAETHTFVWDGWNIVFEQIAFAGNTSSLVEYFWGNDISGTGQGAGGVGGLLMTLVKTSTGVWQVTYNGENRPVRWVRGSTVVTMDFDSMGRRTFYRETENDAEVSRSRFFYDGYLMIQQLDFDSPYVLQKEFIWDPTEPVATKPLVFCPNGMDQAYLTHDGNKNVADVIRAAPYNDRVGHYEYAPFGAVTSAAGTRAMDNPFRFSSEFSDDVLGLDYYNYRHYEPGAGRWTTRDPTEEYSGDNLYVFCAL